MKRENAMFAMLRMRVVPVLSAVWRGVREWCGDAAYERYARAHKRGCSHEALLSRDAFYLEELKKRYSRVSRCC